MQGTAFRKMEELSGYAKEYVRVRIREAKLSAAEKGSGMIARSMSRAVILIIVFIGIGFMSVALALALSRWLNDSVWGFLLTGGIYLLAALILWTRREHWLHVPFMNGMLREFFKGERENDED